MWARLQVVNRDSLSPERATRKWWLFLHTILQGCAFRRMESILSSYPYERRVCPAVCYCTNFTVLLLGPSSQYLSSNKATNLHVNVTLRLVRATTLTVEKQWVLQVLSVCVCVCVCSLWYPAWNAHVLQYTVICGLSAVQYFFTL